MTTTFPGNIFGPYTTKVLPHLVSPCFQIWKGSILCWTHTHECA